MQYRFAKPIPILTIIGPQYLYTLRNLPSLADLNRVAEGRSAITHVANLLDGVDRALVLGEGGLVGVPLVLLAVLAVEEVRVERREEETHSDEAKDDGVAEDVARRINLAV